MAITVFLLFLKNFLQIKKKIKFQAFLYHILIGSSIWNHFFQQAIIPKYAVKYETRHRKKIKRLFQPRLLYESHFLIEN